eukprot:12247158-Alexandrium_andersonii.AAC.1
MRLSTSLLCRKASSALQGPSSPSILFCWLRPPPKASMAHRSGLVDVGSPASEAPRSGVTGFSLARW